MMSVLIELILHLLSTKEESTKSNHSPEMQTHISGLFLGGTQRHLKEAVRGHLRIKTDDASVTVNINSKILHLEPFML